MTEKDQTTDSSATLIDEAYMEQFTNDQLAYKAWCGTDVVKDILFDDDASLSCMADARFEIASADLALRVLIRRLIGMAPEAIRKAVHQRTMASIVLKPEKDQLPAWETLQ